MPQVEISTNFHIEVPDAWNSDGEPTHETKRQYVRSEKVEVTQEVADDWVSKGLAEIVE